MDDNAKFNFALFDYRIACLRLDLDFEEGEGL